MGVAAGRHHQAGNAAALADDEAAIGVKVGQPRNTCRIPRSRPVGAAPSARRSWPAPASRARSRAARRPARTRADRSAPRLPAAEQQRAHVRPPIERGVRHAKGRQIRTQTGDRHGDEVLVAHRHDRQIQTRKMRDMPGMGAGGVDDFGAAHLALSVSTAATAPARSTIPLTRTSVAKRTPAARACSRYAMARS